MTEQRHNPSKALMMKLERWSVEISREFKQMMRQLEQMTEEISGGFNSQSVANTLWVFPKMETKPGDRTME